MVDDLGLSFESTANVRKMLTQYVDSKVRPGDLVAIIRTAGGVGALQQFTTDRRLLHAAIDRVRWSLQSRSGVASFEAVTPNPSLFARRTPMMGEPPPLLQTPDEFREDLRRVKALLEDLIGAPVIGYRAPTYSVTEACPWAHPILAEEGFLYSSSIFPIVHDRYGIADYSRFPVKLSLGGRDLWEFPLTTVRIAGKNLPVAGGGYLRLFPVWTIAKAIEPPVH